ncbi:MAG TPA: hypothetical protein VFW47_12295 [Phenylobacterium sp.]|nr:hypothetical protein [Phenylobacterium sp.]
MKLFAPVFVALLTAGPAAAQVADPIGALLDQAQAPAAEPAPAEESAPAAEPPPPSILAPPPPIVLPPAPPRAPFPYARPAAPADTWTPNPPRPGAQRADGPVQIDETGRTPDAPPSPTDRNYEARMRATFAMSQGLQGPLDGRWVVRDGGSELYDLQLVDKSSGTLEGAWRDPRRKGAANSSGFIDELRRYGGQLTVRFAARPGSDSAVLTLQADADGGWTGELVERGDRRTVTMRRN